MNKFYFGGNVFRFFFLYKLMVCYLFFEVEKESGYKLKVMILIMKLMVLQIFMIIDVFKF